MKQLKSSILELIKTTSTVIPPDVERVIADRIDKEAAGTPARYAMEIIKKNIALAKEKKQPICQDTGSLLFFVKAPQNFNQKEFIKITEEATISATEGGYLRQNSVDPLTGKNSGNNLGPGSPSFHFEQSSGSTPKERELVEVRLMLKGGGSENVGAQYSLPNAGLGAGRDIEGVKRCILDAVVKAQGKGCAPGILGVCIGGDRATGYMHSKEQLLRRLNDTNPDPGFKALEVEILEKANRLEIGPMGFGGKSTILGCKIGFLNRLPACYFVSISYVCWAYRRQGVVLDNNGKIKKWLY